MWVVDIVDRLVMIVVRVDKVVRKVVEEKGEGKMVGRVKIFMEFLGDGEMDMEIV